MKKDYTNKNKKFYDDKENKRIAEENDRFLKMDATLLIYMFNHLDKLVFLLGKIKKCLETNVGMSMIMGFYINDFCIGEAIVKNKEEINIFFKDVNDHTLRGREIYLIRYFAENGIFGEEDFIKYFEKQCKKNNFLKKSIYELEFEKVLEIASYYPNILKLCSLKTRREINELLEVLKEED